MSFGLDLGNVVAHLRLNSSGFASGLAGVRTSLKKFGSDMTQMGRWMSLRVTAPLIAVGTASVKAFANFDKGMTESLAIFGNVSASMRAEMEKTAFDISNKSVTSATELAKAYFYLGSAGLNAAQSMKALSVVDTFAVAGRFDLQKATTLLNDSMASLGLTSKDPVENMKQMTRVADVLVGANTLVNATTEEFAEALQIAGPLMRQYGVELERGVAALAAYGAQAKKGQVGGEMFSRMIRLSVQAMVDNEGAWKKYGISLVTAQDEMKKFSVIGKELSAVLDGMGVTERAKVLKELGFEARSQQALFPLLGMGDAIKEFEERLMSMAGESLRLAEENMKSFSAQMKIMWNQIVNASIAFGRLLAPTILKVNKQIIEAVKWFNGLNDSTKRVVAVVAALAAAVGPVLIMIGFIATGLAAVLSPVVLILVAIAAAAVGVGIAFNKMYKSLYGEGADGSKKDPVVWFINMWKLIQQVAIQAIYELDKLWEYMKFGFKAAVAGMLTVWDFFANAVTLSIGVLLLGLGKVLQGMERIAAKIPGAPKDLGSASINSLAADFISKESRRGADMLEKATETLKKAIAEIDSNSESVFTDIENKYNRIIAERKAKGSLLENMIGYDAVQKVKDAIQEIQVELDKMNDKLKTTINQFKELFQNWVDGAHSAFENMKGAVSSALDGISDEFTDLVLKGKADFNSLANSIVADITRVIIRAQMAKALMGFFGLSPTPLAVPQAVYQTNQSGVPVGVEHQGGIVGVSGARRLVSPGIFAGAARYHGGGSIGGLQYDEVPIIAQRGERIISKEDNKAMERMSQPKGTTIVNITAFDSKDVARVFEENQDLIASYVDSSKGNNHPSRRRNR